MTKVRLSVVVPAYNRADHIGECLDSVLAQESAPPFEVIVVDDGSTDGTADLVAARYPRVRLIRKANGGPGSARNRGVAEAHGEVIVFVDADDVMLPGRLAFQGGFMLAHPEVALSFGNQIYQRDPRRNEYRARGICDSDAFVPVTDLFPILMTGPNLCSNTSSAIRRNVYLEIGGQPENIRIYEDFAMNCAVARRGPVHFSCRYLSWYRQDHGGNLTRSVHTYRDTVIGIQRELVAHGYLLSADQHRQAHALWSRKADLYLQRIWIEGSRAEVLAGMGELSPLLSRRLEAKWTLVSALPPQLGWAAREVRRFWVSRRRSGRVQAVREGTGNEKLG